MAKLPPDYVSLAMLKERWLQKQKEKELEEEEKKLREEILDDLGFKKDEKFESDGASEKKAVKEKAVERIGDFGNEEQKKKWRKRYKKKKKHFLTKQEMVDEEKENPGVDGEMKRANGFKRVEIIRGNESRVGSLLDESRRGGTFGKSAVDVWPRDGGREEVSKVRPVGGRGGFGRDGADRGRWYREESWNDTTNSITPERKAWGGVSAVDRAINGENWKARNGFRSDWSRMENVGRNLGQLALNDLSAGNARTSMELNVGDDRRSGSSGRSKVWKTKQNNWGMVWVKKEKK